MYLAAAAPEPTDDGWPGNPIGTIFRAFVPWDKFRSKKYVHPEVVTDDFYHALSGSVPILDKNGETIAILGVDYSVGPELQKLSNLRRVCLALIIASLVLSVLFSIYITRHLNAPLRQLYQAACDVAKGNQFATVSINSSDEFGLLGRVFNQMLTSIRKSFDSLEAKNTQINSVVCDMHDGVGSILTSIALTSQGREKEQQSINRLARQGLSEVRFLMDALDREACNLELVIDEIEMLAADILTPSGVELALEQPQKLPDDFLEFRTFLELQRIFREVFTNIIKHTDADRCTVEIRFTDKQYLICIQDNGRRISETKGATGRRLPSISGRIKRLGGRVKHSCDGGFRIEITLPRTVD